MPSSGTHPDLARYIAATLGATWAAIGIASAIGTGFVEGLSANAVSGLLANVLLGGASSLGYLNATRWRTALLTAIGLVTAQRIAAVIGYGGATDAVIAALLALVAIAGPTLIGIKPKQQ